MQVEYVKHGTLDTRLNWVIRNGHKICFMLKSAKYNQGVQLSPPSECESLSAQLRQHPHNENIAEETGDIGNILCIYMSDSEETGDIRNILWTYLSDYRT